MTDQPQGSSSFLKRVLLLLTVFYGLRLLFNLFLPVLDPSEARYASIIGFMANTGDWLTPRFYHEGVFQSFDGKTPFFFWLGALASKVFGVSDFAVRLPSTLAAGVILATLYAVLHRYKSSTQTALALLFCGASCAFIVFAGVVLTDMVLTACVAGAILSFTGAMSEEENLKLRKLRGLAVFAFLGVGFITKGPIAIALFGIGPFFWLLLHRKWKMLARLPWFSGMLLFLLIAVPWFILKWQDDKEAVIYFFYNENFLRFIKPEYGDRYGAGRELHFGASVWMLLIMSFPWGVLWGWKLLKKETRLQALGCGQNIWRDPVDGIALYSFLGMTAFWALTSRVLLYYMLPTIPFVAVWLAGRCAQWYQPETNGKTARTFLCAGVFFMMLSLAGHVASTFYAVRSGASTANVIRSAEQLCAEHYGSPAVLGIPLYFARETPYSAMFYGDAKTFRHHKKEAELESWEKSGDCILLIRERHWKRLKENRHGDAAAFEPVARVNGWFLFLPRETWQNRD